MNIVSSGFSKGKRIFYMIVLILTILPMAISELRADGGSGLFGSFISEKGEEIKDSLTKRGSLFSSSYITGSVTNYRPEKESTKLETEYELNLSLSFKSDGPVEYSIGIDGLDLSRTVFGGYYSVKEFNADNKLVVGLEITKIGDATDSYNGWHSRLAVRGLSAFTEDFGVSYGITEGFYYNELYSVSLGIIYRLGD